MTNSNQLNVLNIHFAPTEICFHLTRTVGFLISGEAEPIHFYFLHFGSLPHLAHVVMLDCEREAVSIGHLNLRKRQLSGYAARLSPTWHSVIDQLARTCALIQQGVSMRARKRVYIRQFIFPTSCLKGMDGGEKKGKKLLV